jgi:pimeloyl-ACP methyl ester carboxylesterase
MFESKTPDLYAAQIHALLSRPDGSALLPLIRCPTLVLCGNEDSWAPPLQHREITDAIPGSRLSVVPECGHMATLERPGAVSEAMRAWLQDVLNFGKERAGAGNDPRAAAASGAR